MEESITAAPVSTVVPLELIDPPDVAMRQTMSDDGLASLAASLKDLGQLQELVVVQAGTRYRIAAGHRRRISLALAGFPTARVLVFPEGTPLEEAIKVTENDEREEVNAAERAVYYRWQLDHCFDGDVERLAAFVHRPLSGVLDSLDLTRGDPAVLDALREPLGRKSESALASVFPEHDLTRLPKIALAVARELNKVKDERYRRLFLHDAIRLGANSTVVRKWREDQAHIARYNDALEAQRATPTPASSESAIVNIDECPLCESADDQHEMEYVKVHRSCRSALRRQRRAGAPA